MWQFKENDKSDAICIEEESFVQEISEFAKSKQHRETYDELISGFVNDVRFRRPITDALLDFIADTIDRLNRGQGVVKISDVMGPRGKGSQGKSSKEKNEQHSKIAIEFLTNKLHGMTYSENIVKTAEKCGVSSRTVENVSKDRARTISAFRYQRPTEKK